MSEGSMSNEMSPTGSLGIKMGVEKNRSSELEQKISKEISKAFQNPMTEYQLGQYERMANEANEKTMQSGKRDDALETELQEMIDSHSAIAENPEEFYELLRQMNNDPHRPDNFDFVKEYYDHELLHNQKADELGFINKGFRVLIMEEENGNLSFLPTQAAEPQPNWTLKEYYQKQLEIIKAPGEDMSDGDKEDYDCYLQRLKDLDS